MTNLIGKTKLELQKILAPFGFEKFRINQIFSWIYAKGVKNFDEMSNLNKEKREILKQNFNLNRPKIDQDLLSKDGTRKWLIKFDDKNLVEVVFIPEKNRATLCISSQIGCTLACKFCHTGTQTLVRNLTSAEIILQVILAKDLLNDFNKKENEAKTLTNIVFMGMGEPFFNYENVKNSVEILTDKNGLGLSHKRITISTSGLVPEILKASKELKTELAISLHSADEETRTKIMAINKKYCLDDLMKACKKYNQENAGRKITFEYVMLDGVNDSKEDACKLINLIKKYNINAKINLIPFNPWNFCDFEDSSSQKTKKFQEILQNSGLVAPIRKTRGQDAMAACGQLKSDSVRKKKSQRKAKE